MELTKKQKAFIDFIPVLNVRKTVLQMYAIILFLVPAMINYYIKMLNVDYGYWLVIIVVDVILFLVSIPILVKPKVFFGLFHLLMGVTSCYVSILVFLSFVIEVNLIHKLEIVNLGFAIVIYLIAVFTENFLIVRANFQKYPKSTNKMTPLLLVAPIIGMIVYNLVADTIRINGMAIAAYLLAIGLGVPIHSLYRGYIIIKYKYKPSDVSL